MTSTTLQVPESYQTVWRHRPVVQHLAQTFGRLCGAFEVAEISHEYENKLECVAARLESIAKMPLPHELAEPREPKALFRQLQIYWLGRQRAATRFQMAFESLIDIELPRLARYDNAAIAEAARWTSLGIQLLRDSLRPDPYGFPDFYLRAMKSAYGSYSETLRPDLFHALAETAQDETAMRLLRMRQR